MPIFSATLDDIVFEGRNQAYGAYQLRRDYGSSVASAGGITAAILLLLAMGWLAWPAAQPKPVEQFSTGILDPIQVPAPEIERPKQAKLAPARAPHRAAALPSAPTLPTQVAPDKLVPPAPAVAPVAVAAVTSSSSADQVSPPADELAELGGGPGGSRGGSEAVANSATSEGTSTAFTYVEKMPEFAGGEAALLRYLQQHLRYPSQALREGTAGRVYVSFVVRANGTIAEATVLKGLGAGLDEEALRVVRQMPAWTPGYQARHAVAVRFTLPITFKIQ